MKMINNITVEILDDENHALISVGFEENGKRFVIDQPILMSKEAEKGGVMYVNSELNIYVWGADTTGVRDNFIDAFNYLWLSIVRENDSVLEPKALELKYKLLGMVKEQ
jgi:hypothetical protein